MQSLKNFDKQDQALKALLPDSLQGAVFPSVSSALNILLGFLSYEQSFSVSETLFQKHRALLERFVERGNLTLNLFDDANAKDIDTKSSKLPSDCQLVLFEDWATLESLDSLRKVECSQALLVYLEAEDSKSSLLNISEWPFQKLDAWIGQSEQLCLNSAPLSTSGIALSPHTSLMRFLHTERSFII